jgi:two-component system cell cycle response regulator DivK
MAISKKIEDWVVLIVDDAPDNVEVARKVLSYRGATVYVAADGQKGLEILEGIQPTFILLDLSMPVLDGWQMLERIRQQPEKKDIPVIALTAHAMHGVREKVFEAGFNGYIVKPFRLNSFLAQIRDVLAKINKET